MIDITFYLYHGFQYIRQTELFQVHIIISLVVSTNCEERIGISNVIVFKLSHTISYPVTSGQELYLVLRVSDLVAVQHGHYPQLLVLAFNHALFSQLGAPLITYGKYIQYLLLKCIDIYIDQPPGVPLRTF